MGYFFDIGRKLFKDVRNGMKEVVTEWDPELATEVEIQQMEKEFDKINAEVTRAKREMEREITEYRDKRYYYDQVLASAKLLQDQGHTQKAIIQMDKAEAMMPEVEKEKIEADEATEYFVTLQKELNEFARKITVSKQTIESKRRQAELAKLKAQSANRKVENAKILAGLKERTSGMSTLVQIYDKQREEAEHAADSAKRKAEMFTSAAPSANKEEDPEIAAAMAATDPTKKTPSSESLEERLARLRNLG